MKKRVSLAVLGLVLAGVAASHLSWEEKDNGYLLVIDGREVDVLGQLRNDWNRALRNCTRVSFLSAQDPRYLQAKATIQAYSPPQSSSAQLAGVWAAGDWTLAEVEFAQLLPAVVLMHTVNGATAIVPSAVWSGYTQPWKAAPHIRRYLSQQGGAAPPDLFECFEPQSASFH
ncbi:hypothetical protein [Limnohabitans sp. B9-3]|uniref:hypothetical protein n=1 Tax=Limnohabitans sp. B9-3 TaxID=1100707 RepID=UPI000C1F2BE6|nr:hypothetical protein [Limnohabitans sp. B9-3]PIT78797.1 hypothetical protein B9Z42_01520 [Limnohabitans sp. B9-3]